MKSAATIVFSALYLVLLFEGVVSFDDGGCVPPSSTKMEAFLERIDRLEKQLLGEFASIKNNQLNKIAGSSTPVSSPPLIMAPSSTFQGVPKGCDDLLTIGHITNGFYAVQNKKKIDLLYCNFTLSKVIKDTRVGFIDVKSSSVHFHVHRNSSLSNARKNNTPINPPAMTVFFPIELMNIGNAMNPTTGVFTAPKSGIYRFAFSGVKKEGLTLVYLRLNGVNIAASHGSVLSGLYTISLDATVQLKVGDQIYLVITEGSLHDDKQQFTSFTGALLEEDLPSNCV